LPSVASVVTSCLKASPYPGTSFISVRPPTTSVRLARCGKCSAFGFIGRELNSRCFPVGSMVCKHKCFPPERGGLGGRTFSVRQLINLQRFVITCTCWKVRIPYFLFSDKCVFLMIRKRCAACALRKKGARPALEGRRYLASAACLFLQLQLHVLQKVA
jgi:hypothetical protein